MFHKNALVAAMLLANAPALDLDFTQGNIDPRITYTGGAGGTYMDETGTIRPQRVNVALWSQTFSNAIWSKAAATVTGNAIAAPDGTMTADFYAEDSATAAHQLTQAAITVNPGATVTASLYVKAGARTQIELALVSGTDSIRAIFDLAALSATPFSSGTGAISSATVTDAGGGWRRIVVAGLTAAAASSCAIRVRLVNAGATTYAGDGVSGLYVWGMQLESGSQATAYMATTTAAVAAPRIDCTNPRTNFVRNSSMVGAGIDTLPTNWGLENLATGAGTNGLVTSIGAPVVEGGINYLPVRIQGTAVATLASFIHVDTTTGVPCLAGDQRVFSYSLKTVANAGTLPTYGHGWRLQNGGTTLSSQDTSSLSLPLLGGPAARSFTTNTPGNVSTTSIRPRIFFAITAGIAYDFTVWIGAPMVEFGAVPSEFIPTASGAVTVAQRNGVLGEEVRANSIRNSTMQGGVAPSTQPTNWSNALSASVGGVSPTFAFGSENGIPYIDLIYSGTTSSQLATPLLFEPASGGPAALSGQTWTTSLYARLVAGALPANLLLQICAREYDGSAVFLTQALKTITPTSSPLNTQRNSNTATLSGGTTATLVPALRVDTTAVAISTAVSFTLRIGLPQLEQGATVTSPIPTYGAAVTRTVEAPILGGGAFTQFYNPNEGTLFVECTFDTPSDPNTEPVASLDDGTNTNRIQIYRPSLANSVSTFIGPPGSGPGSRTIAVGAIVKAAMTWNATDTSSVTNGQPAQNQSQANTGLALVNRLSIGRRADGGTSLNGHVRRIRYWPKRLSEDQLQRMTA